MGLGVQRFVIFLLFLGVLGIVGLQAWARTASAPADIGPLEGQLRPCEPGAANCVVSTSDDPQHAVAPLECPGLLGEDLLARVRDVLLQQPRTAVANQQGGWVHVVSTSAFFGFRDDVELLLRGNLRFVDVRSESRLGSGDQGVNRDRVERLAADLADSCTGS